MITFGASGAPTLVTASSKGVVSVTKNSTGLYTIVLGTIRPGQNPALDTYHHSLNIDALWDATSHSGTAPAAPLVYRVNSAIGTAASFQIATTNVSQADTNPASGERLILKMTLCNSNNVS